MFVNGGTKNELHQANSIVQAWEDGGSHAHNIVRHSLHVLARTNKGLADAVNEYLREELNY